MEHTQLPRGLRNCNPLNIRHSASKWQGARSEQTDKSFVQFTSMAYGYRAAWRVMASYRKRFRKECKPFTPRTIIHRWAPPSENNSEAYLHTVCLLTGLGGNEQMEWDTHAGRQRMVRLLQGMTCVECGIKMKDINPEDIIQGYEKAFPQQL